MTPSRIITLTAILGTLGLALLAVGEQMALKSLIEQTTALTQSMEDDGALEDILLVPVKDEDKRSGWRLTYQTLEEDEESREALRQKLGLRVLLMEPTASSFILIDDGFEKLWVEPTQFTTLIGDYIDESDEDAD